MADPVKIAIVLEGGALSAVLTVGVPVEYVLVDYDVEGESEERIHLIPQSGGGLAEAMGHVGEAEVAGPFVLAAFDAVGASPPPAEIDLPAGE